MSFRLAPARCPAELGGDITPSQPSPIEGEGSGTRLAIGAPAGCACGSSSSAAQKPSPSMGEGLGGGDAAQSDGDRRRDIAGDQPGLGARVNSAEATIHLEPASEE